MDHIETAILNCYGIREAEQNMVFAARLTQHGHTIQNMADLMELYHQSYSQNTVENIAGLPHPTVQKFMVITVAVVGASRRFLAQITRHQKGYCFMSCKTIYVMISSFLSEEEKMIVAAHELGHIILHRSQLKMAPMQDDTLYNMTDNTEYQANLFAADLLIDDEEIEDMVQNEDLDYFGLCSSLNATPELMSFKLYSLTKRGQAYHMPMEIQSNFLAK